MLFLESQDPGKDIRLYINSPGGSVLAGFALYDIMQYIKCDVSTICIGLAASFGAFLLAGGAKGKRFVKCFFELLTENFSAWWETGAEKGAQNAPVDG